MATNGVNGAHSRSAASEKNPSYLPPRFEIRRLEEKHIPWASAVVIHSNMYCSPVWPVCYPEKQTQRALDGFKAADYLVRHQVESGMSFGVFDTEYKFKRPESEATEGAVYWDDISPDATQQEMLDAMDNPLATVALAYDGINALDMEKLMPLIAVLPLFGMLYGILHVLDTRPEESHTPTGPKQFLMRNATSTRQDYEGFGLMRKLANFLMREAKLEGFKAINIECLHDAVAHTWSHPPEPFKAELICKFKLDEWEDKDEKTGEVTHPFKPATQVASKIQVNL
ncbi:hypothetical protein NA57DRAFT_53023 [Rhizodiscina lignyota]|uniref:Uncharacterized protein n=1 Tax=Rhizodiscina lignyota TaxID=1504668 RepID=A0A9P4IL33_9PEZI|nr:hypothetical protein NA57DRAFT_53023 [Rhizodiscina lignyota]